MTLYGIAEIARALGVSRGLVAQWHKRGKLPEPTARLASGPVWTAKTIEPWIRRQRT
jgi:predicted site-specific integrase-resolvase